MITEAPITHSFIDILRTIVKMCFDKEVSKSTFAIPEQLCLTDHQAQSQQEVRADQVHKRNNSKMLKGWMRLYRRFSSSGGKKREL